MLRISVSSPEFIFNGNELFTFTVFSEMIKLSMHDINFLYQLITIKLNES